jgi:hypothetical protein
MGAFTCVLCSGMSESRTTSRTNSDEENNGKERSQWPSDVGFGYASERDDQLGPAVEAAFCGVQIAVGASSRDERSLRIMGSYPSTDSAVKVEPVMIQVAPEVHPTTGSIDGRHSRQQGAPHYCWHVSHRDPVVEAMKR